MRVAFLHQELGRSDGVAAVVAHAAGLRRAHGVDAALVLTEAQLHASADHPGLREVPVLGWSQAATRTWDVAVASDAETALAVFDLGARRNVALLRADEQTLHAVDARERLGAAMATALPLHLLAGGAWLAEELGALRGGEPVPVVPDPVLKDVFASPPAPWPATPGGPLRVVLEGDAEDERSGVADALLMFDVVKAPVHVTWVAPSATVARPREVHRLLAGLGAAERAELLADHHVLLRPTRGEESATPVVEAFHMGCTAVVSPTAAHAEVVRHGIDGLIGGFDDIYGTARLLDLLHADRELLDRLRREALHAAAAWPGAAEATAALAAELERIVAAPAPPGARAASRRMAYDMVDALADTQNAARRAEIAAAVKGELFAEEAYAWAERARAEAGRVRRAKARAKGLSGR